MRQAKAMKQILTGFGLISAFALLVLAVGCASTQQTENLLLAAGFRVVTVAYDLFLHLISAFKRSGYKLKTILS
jgi:hypothetical protein